MKGVDGHFDRYEAYGPPLGYVPGYGQPKRRLALALPRVAQHQHVIDLAAGVQHPGHRADHEPSAVPDGIGLGLTESLEVGYRLSPRGRAVLECLVSDPR